MLLTKPAYVTMDPSGQYLLAACHSGRSFVTKVVHNAKGDWTSAVLCDDAGIVLVRIHADGSLGQVCDVALHCGVTPNRQQLHAHPHSIIANPDGSIYFACDKGLDRIYSYKLDREAGKLIPLVQTRLEYAVAPRYGVFHPTLPVFYENNETDSRVFAFQYDRNSGVLDRISAVPLWEDQGDTGIMPSDIALHPNGRYLYAAVRQLKTLVVLDVDPMTGAISRREAYPTGMAVRGVCISPDGRFLLAACNVPGIVTVFGIGADGSLQETGRSYEAASAANIQIITA